MGAAVPAATDIGAKSLPIVIADAEARSGSATITLTVEAAPPPPPLVEISEIQGAGHLSPHNLETLTVTGVVTGKFGSSFYLQDPTPDASSDTSEGLQVFGASAAALVAAATRSPCAAASRSSARGRRTSP